MKDDLKVLVKDFHHRLLLAIALLGLFVWAAMHLLP